MKKQILLFLALIMSMMATAQVTIQMEKEGGVYKVPCTVNGVKMKFIFDTGAATVSMSQTMAQFLLDGDYLSENDIKGTGQSQLADGSIVNHASIVLRDVEIGGMHIHDIDATVIEGQNAPLLLGQTAIQELGRVSIEGNKLIIHSVENKLTQQQIEQLDEQAIKYMDAHSYVAAIECLTKIEGAVGLTEYGLKNLCYCYAMSDSYYDCIQTCKRWVNEFDKEADVINKEMVYNYMADAYNFGFDDYDNALLWYQKDLAVMNSSTFSEYLSDDKALYKRLLAGVNCRIADCHYYKNTYYQAIPSYKQAIKLRCESIGVTMEVVQDGRIQDDRLGSYLYSYAFCFYKQKKDSDGDEVMKLAALCGNQDAIDFCRKYNINYQVKSSKLFE